MREEIQVRQANDRDFDAMWPIFQQIVQQGETYMFNAETTWKEGFAYWFGSGVTSYVAEENTAIVGMYKLVANQPGRGAHVANASFMVSASHIGQGIGKLLAQHCLEKAKRSGFLAIQFNCVVSTNSSAISLWKKMGFSIVGTVPKAFRHAQLGYVDIFIMHRFL